MSFLTHKTFIQFLQLRYFWWNPRAFCPCIDSKAIEMFPEPESRSTKSLFLFTSRTNIFLQLCKTTVEPLMSQGLFTDILTAFLGRGTFQLHLMENILICVLKMKKGLMVLRVSNYWQNFNFWVNYFFKILEIVHLFVGSEIQLILQCKCCLSSTYNN